MKFALLTLLLLSNSAFARYISYQVTITKGPYFVPVVNSVFNPLDSNFKSEGTAVVFMTDMKINVEFPRVPLFTLEAMQDQDGSNYFSSKSDQGPGVRVGFEGEKLSWFYSSNSNVWDNWDVRISEEAREQLVPPTSFTQMNDDQITEFAERIYEETENGSLENAKIQRNGSLIKLTADAMQLSEACEEPVGKAVVTFHDNAGAREIVVKARVKDCE